MLAVLWSAFPPLCGFLLIGYASTVSDWLHARGSPASVLIYVGAFILSAGLGLLPTYAQSLLAGWCFHFAVGFPAAWIGFGGASIVGYIVARTVSRHRVEDLIRENPKARAVRDTMIGHGFWKTLGIVTLLRLPPNSPFALTNLVMSSTGVPIGPFVIGTLLGMAPRTALAVYLGSTMKSFTTESTTTALPMWVKITGIAVSVIVVVIVGLIADRAIKRVTVKAGHVQSEPVAPA